VIRQDHVTDPLGICEEVLPRRHLRVAILPAQEINEFLVVWFTTLARKYNIETVTPHNRHALPAEAVVKVLFIPCVELVDAQLVPFDTKIGTGIFPAGQRSLALMFPPASESSVIQPSSRRGPPTQG
jgi:hypothetical protein